MQGWRLVGVQHKARSLQDRRALGFYSLIDCSRRVSQLCKFIEEYATDQLAGSNSCLRSKSKVKTYGSIQDPTQSPINQRSFRVDVLEQLSLWILAEKFDTLAP
jgi:hypothetical protein